LDKCPKCGHWMLNYESFRQQWVCFCQYTIYNNANNEGCHCNHTIRESYKSLNNRLCEQNKKGIHSVEPPLNTMNCSVANCKCEGKHWRISIDSPNSTALNGYLCDKHYEKLLDFIRKLIDFVLREENGSVPEF
jgi:hypothetical protein